MQVEANGDRLVKEFRKERFVDKIKKLSCTIPKRDLPQIDYRVQSELTTTTTSISPKMIAAAHRDIEIVRQRGMALDVIYGHDILPISTIFEGDLTSNQNQTRGH